MRLREPPGRQAGLRRVPSDGTGLAPVDPWPQGGHGPVHHLTRETYSPERVSTLMVSSWATNSGTRTTAPVSSVAGLPPVPAVSPFTPGSVSTIFSSTKFGGVTWVGLPFHRVATDRRSER